MSDIPRIGPAPTAQEQMLRRQQEQALENLFQAACAKAKDVMSQVVGNKVIPYNVESLESEVLRAGMGAAAMFVSQQFAASIAQQFGQHVEQQNKIINELNKRIAELEAKLGIQK